ncbi:hypothetical protein EVAR_39896_1 [Eumeta japonica]|uniref:Uncharacterized protein n=1 Tax=Eumeta variegata TaxID=151549 RepID=A0A4C1WQQ8_EUMVA|nr:hypothetical protein EVAR_39896_1 [Eumeta japonica]
MLSRRLQQQYNRINGERVTSAAANCAKARAISFLNRPAAARALAPCDILHTFVYYYNFCTASDRGLCASTTIGPRQIFDRYSCGKGEMPLLVW